MNKPPTKQMRREDLKPGESLCEHCTAKCCRYFTVSLERPTTFEEFEYFRWYLLHDFATIFTEGENWFLLVHSNCQHLRSDFRCGIYDTRPKICQDYSTSDCEYDDDYTYDRYFETPEQLFEFAQARFGDPSKPNFRTPRPSLAIIQ